MRQHHSSLWRVKSVITTSGNRKWWYLEESSSKQSSVFHWCLFLMSHSNLKSVQLKLYSLKFFPKTPSPCVSNFVVLQISSVLRDKKLKSHSSPFLPPSPNSVIRSLSLNSSILDPLPLTDFDYQLYYSSHEPIPGQLHEHETSIAHRACSQRALCMRFNALQLPSQNS